MSTGSRDYGSGGASNYLDWGTWAVTSNSMTIACWIYIDSFSSGRDDRFVSKADGSGTANHDWMLGKTDSSGPKLRARANRTGNTLVSGTNIPTGEWVHAALVIDDDASFDKAGILYQNGVEVARNNDIFGTVGSGLPNNTNSVYVGNQPTSTSSSPDGRISDVAVWSRALTAGEISDLADLTSRPSDLSTGLEAYLSGGDLTDSSGNGRNATNSGTTLEVSDPGFSAGPDVTGTGALDFPAVTASGTGQVVGHVTGTGDIDLPAITAAGSGLAVTTITGTGELTLPAITVDGSGGASGSDVTGSGSLALPAITVAGTGLSVSVVTGTGAITLPAVTASGTGNSEEQTPDVYVTGGAAALTLPAIEASGSGNSVGGVSGSGALDLPAITVSGSGLAVTTITGTGTISLPAISIAGSGGVDVPVSGTGELTLPAATVSGTGTASTTLDATGAFSLPAARVSGSGTVSDHPSGLGELSLPAIVISGSGTVTGAVTSSGAMSLPAVTISGVGVASTTLDATGSIALPAITISGIGRVNEGIARAFRVTGKRRRRRFRSLSSNNGVIMIVYRMQASEAAMLTWDFSRDLETVWLPGTVVSASSYARPTSPNGYEYQCTTGGQSGTKEPNWPTSEGDTVTDGSIVWTAVAFGTNATDTISTVSVTSDADMTVSDTTQSNGAVTAKVTSSVKGTHNVLFSVGTAAGETIKETIRVVVS